MGEAALTTGLQLIVVAFGFAVTWGITLSRIKNLEKYIEEYKDQLEKHIDDTKDNYVSLAYFHAVIKPMQSQLNDLIHDTKKILMIVSRYESN